MPSAKKHSRWGVAAFFLILKVNFERDWIVLSSPCLWWVVRLIYPQGHSLFVSDLGPAIVFDTIMKEVAFQSRQIRSEEPTPCLPIIGIYALHIYLYFQPWIFTRREPHRCPSLESSSWLKTLSSAVLHLEKIDKGAEIGATLIESFFYCYCVENRFVMSTVVPDTAVLSLFFILSPFLSSHLSLSEPFSSSALPHRDQGELSP